MGLNELRGVQQNKDPQEYVGMVFIDSSKILVG